MVLKPFLSVAADSQFSIENLPYGIFSTPEDKIPRPGVAIGEYIVDLKTLVKAGFFTMYCSCQFPLKTLTQTTLNDFATLGREVVGAVRLFVKYLLVETTPVLRDDIGLRKECLIRQAEATMHLPFHVGDFTDFLNSPTHAKNTHTTHATPVNMFDPPRAFYGSASSIVPSGTSIVRPMGHLHDETGKAYIGPSKELDVEIELGFFIGLPSERFKRIPIAEADDHIFGVVMLNDWSTRDVQRPEDHPFAAFNAKSFASTISPWVVTLDALAPFTAPPASPPDAPLLPYLTDPTDSATSTYDISIRMDWTLDSTSASTSETVPNVSTSNLRNAYWNFRQMLTHQAFNGAKMRTGDLLGTGTITGTDATSICSLVERTQNGTWPLKTAAGKQRLYVEDGDEVCFTAWAGTPEKGRMVGFGECRGVILPAVPLEDV